MARKFTITTPTNLAQADAQGRVQVQFTVTNTSGMPERRLFRVVPLGDAKESWLSLAGESERSFPPDGVHQISVAANVPPGTPAGRYGFRLDSISATRAGEEIEEGPAVYFDVAAPAPPKKSKAWLWILIAVLALVIAIVLWLLLRPKSPSGEGNTGTMETTATTATADHGPFRVTDATVTASPSDFNGTCPAVITFSGRITTAGGSGTVKYRFFRGDGATGPIEALAFDAPGSKDVSTTWTLGGSGMNYDGWEAIRILEPNETESAHASFRLHCQ
jgi:hypothetical protein